MNYLLDCLYLKEAFRYSFAYTRSFLFMCPFKSKVLYTNWMRYFTCVEIVEFVFNMLLHNICVKFRLFWVWILDWLLNIQKVINHSFAYRLIYTHALLFMCPFKMKIFHTNWRQYFIWLFISVYWLICVTLVRERI